MREFLLSPRLVWTMVLLATWISLPPSQAFAMPSDSPDLVFATSVREAQIQSVMSALSRPEAKAHLMMMGVSESQLKQQLSELDDSQLAAVSQKSEEIKVAGQLGLIIVLLVIAILVVILLAVAGKKVEIKDQK